MKRRDILKTAIALPSVVILPALASTPRCEIMFSDVVILGTMDPNPDIVFTTDWGMHI